MQSNKRPKRDLNNRNAALQEVGRAVHMTEITQRAATEIETVKETILLTEEIVVKIEREAKIVILDMKH